MNAVVYEKVQTRLQDVWGDKAGWAQQVSLPFKTEVEAAGAPTDSG